MRQRLQTGERYLFKKTVGHKILVPDTTRSTGSLTVTGIVPALTETHGA